MNDRFTREGSHYAGSHAHGSYDDGSHDHGSDDGAHEDGSQPGAPVQPVPIPPDVQSLWTALLGWARDPKQSNEIRYVDGCITILPDGGWLAEPALSAAGNELLDLYLPLARAHQITYAQLGQTLDGRIATVTGHSHYVTGTADAVHLHRLRALADAVVVGPGTMLADDPRLTVRHVEGPNPVRVIVDPKHQVHGPLRALTEPDAPTWILYSAETAGFPDLAAHVRTLPLTGSDSGLAPDTILAALFELGLRRILIEGGGRTVSRFLAANRLDYLYLSVAPILLGSGIPALSLPPVARLTEALRPPCRQYALGADRLYVFQLESQSRNGF